LNKYLYREIYDYQRTVREASHRLSTMLDLDPLLDYLVNAIDLTFRTESVSIYLREPTGVSFLRIIPRATESHPGAGSQRISDTAPLISALDVLRTTIVREEAMRTRHYRQLTEASLELKDLGAEVAFPLI